MTDDEERAAAERIAKTIDFAARRKREAEANSTSPGGPAMWADSTAWDESRLVMRPWVVPGYLLRGSVTIVAGPGSAGKSTLTLGWGVAMALGERLGNFVAPEPMKVMIYNVEDDADEQRRRLSAVLRSFGRSSRDIAGRVVRCGPLGVGTLLEIDPQFGRLSSTATLDELESKIAATRPDAVILDPLAELHTAEENDNTVLRLVIARLRQMARQYQCAVLLVHHTRKGAEAGDVDAIRGASSIIGAARSAFTCVGMTAEAAEELGIPEHQRRAFFRVDSVKQNYAPTAAADWHELVEHQLDNGETLPAAVAWQAPQAAQGPSLEGAALLAAEVARGTAGGPYSARMALDEARSVAPLMARYGIHTAEAQRKALKALLAQGFSVQAYRNSEGNVRNGIRAPDGGPDVRWVV